MAFATGTGTNKSFDSIFQKAEGSAKDIKNRSQAVANDSASGGLGGEAVVSYFNALGAQRARLDALVSGISAAEANAYASVRYNATGYDVAANYSAMQTEIDNVLAWMAANVTVANLLSFNTTTRQVDWQVFTVGQTNGFRTAVNALIATID